MNRETERKDNHTPGEIKKPTHKTYGNDRNILYPEPYNAGLDEMEVYYEPLIGECLRLMRVWVNHEDTSHGGIEIGSYNTYYDGLKQAKAILAKRKGEL